MHRSLLILSLGATLLFAACGDDDDDNGNTPTPPTQPDSSDGGTGTDSVGPAATRLITPHGGQTGLNTALDINFTFDGAMDSTAAFLVDLHRGDSTGTSIVTRQNSVRCLFSLGRTLLRCSPVLPLSAGTTYLVHFGGGMLNSDGQPIVIPEGDSLGISRVARPDSAFHGTMPLDSLPEGWFNTDSTVGYSFVFSTDTAAGGIRAARR